VTQVQLCALEGPAAPAAPAKPATFAFLED
jgi:hypothetical protein